MNFDDVRLKLKRKNQILFDRESECLQDLLSLIRTQNHRVLVLWSLECAREIAVKLQTKYPTDTRPMELVNISYEWARGKVKMPEAKRYILAVHSMAKELASSVDVALCHAVGQGCSSIHTEAHAIGLPIYELTAIVCEYGIDDCEDILENKIKYYTNHLKECVEKEKVNNYEWAKFLLVDRPNKEMLLYERIRK